MKNNSTYRCACCEELKPTNNMVYRLWTQKKKPSESEVYGICRKCNNAIKKASPIYGLKEYLEWVTN